jgi:hypothetical protein
MGSFFPKNVFYFLILGVTSVALLLGAAVCLPGSWPDKPVFIGAAAIGMVVGTIGSEIKRRMRDEG